MTHFWPHNDVTNITVTVKQNFTIWEFCDVIEFSSRGKQANIMKKYGIAKDKLFVLWFQAKNQNLRILKRRTSTETSVLQAANVCQFDIDNQWPKCLFQTCSLKHTGLEYFFGPDFGHVSFLDSAIFLAHMLQ